MSDHRPPELDLLPDGTFRTRQTPVAVRIFRWAVVIAVVCGMLVIAALALWFALLLIPLVLGAALIAWLAFRYQMWRARQPGGGRNVWRP